jgi:hypothetical protein
MWFGEFIHGVMETAYRLWRTNRVPFPWPCAPTPFNAPTPQNRPPHDIGVIGDLVEATLSAAGKSPRSRDLRDSGYRRAELAVNDIGPALFPLITVVEERVIGTRPLVMPAGIVSRARMYELHGVMDVLSSGRCGRKERDLRLRSEGCAQPSVRSGDHRRLQGLASSTDRLAALGERLLGAGGLATPDVRMAAIPAARSSSRHSGSAALY